MRSLTKIESRVVLGVLYGATRGGAAGAVASIATGAAITVTAPAWLPFVGGSALVAMSTVALWSGVGSATGAIVSGARAYWTCYQEEKAFEEAFPKISNNKGKHEY
jgi:hypothetical protein